MKPIKQFLDSSISFRRLINYGFGILVVISQCSCFKQFYQTNTVHSVTAPMLEKLDSSQKLFIVHTSINAFSLKNVNINSEMISGDRHFSNSKYDDLLNPQGEKGNKMSKAERAICLSEVHLYTNSSFDGKSHIDLAIDSIYRIDVYSKDQEAIRKSRVESIVGIGVGVGAIVVLGVLVANSMSNMLWTY